MAGRNGHWGRTAAHLKVALLPPTGLSSAVIGSLVSYDGTPRAMGSDVRSAPKLTPRHLT